LPDSSERFSQADNHLLKQVLAGDEDGWRAVVARFGPRLRAFAERRIGKSLGGASADDLVQETFVSFLKSAKTFRADCSLETFLFRIMRYRINDHFRKSFSGKESHWSPFDVLQNEEATDDPSSGDLTASRYARQAEQLQQDQQRLSDAVFDLTSELKQRERFRDLKVAEGLFFAGLKNRQLAAAISVTENEVAVVKHRLLARLRALMANRTDVAVENFEERLLPDLEQIWLDQRPSCPKRTTLGKYALEILSDQWNDFVHFHVGVLGCGFCQANLVELKSEEIPLSKDSEELFQSTIGFLHRQ
jgi:RNA polymerase sigma factor (sigma-70 family)